MAQQKRVQVQIEFGHQAISKDNPANHFTHDWTVFVKGVNGADISHIIEKVVFHLHESFPKPKRVCKEPPYTISESGYGSFTLPIEVFFKTTAREDPRKHLINYELTLQLRGLPPLNVTKIEALTFLNPSDEFEKRLLKAGAIIVPAGGEETPKVKSEKSSPAPPSHDSPNPHKKSITTPSVGKGKKENHNARPHSSVKRSSDEISATKIKKKKTEKHEHQTPGLKEIAILSPSNDNDSLKTKSMNSVKKLKEERARRKSLDNNDTPKHSKDKHKNKEIKIKKEKSIDQGGIPKLKFSLKRKPDASWAPSDKDEISKNDDNTSENTTNTIVTNNNTTVAQQNDVVKKSNAEIAQQELEDEIEEDKADSSISSNGSVDNVLSNKTSKKSKNKSKSSNLSQTGKNKFKDFDSKSLHHGNAIPDIDLTSLYTKINELEDSNTLQGIVDLVESSGEFEIGSSTFDFDLSSLNMGTISAIKNLLEMIH